MENDLELRAYQFARFAHEGQFRKYTGGPYIVHPVAVATMVRSVPHTKAMVCAAYLHDVLEDPPVSGETLCNLFGLEVTHLVYWLTDVSKPSDGNRAARKAIDREHLRHAPPEAKTIKLADLLDNSTSILQHDQGFAKTYIQEMDLLHPVLSTGDPTLLARVKEVVYRPL